MAQYKVPQDVEADDKIVGPFSFRQFVYLGIVALAGALAWGLAQIFIVLVIIPLPIIVLFGALALPLRKDQPMEIYLAALVSFYLKPRQRLWDPEGVESLIEITTPKAVDEVRTKDITADDAEQRLGYLANIVDSRGWAIRSMGVQTPNTPLNPDAYYAAQQVEDVLSDTTAVSQSITQRMDEAAERARQEAIERMRNPAPAPVIPDQVAPTAVPSYNPYPDDMKQAVVEPDDDADAAATNPTAPTTSSIPPNTDIMNLVNNTDGLSIETVAKEANRLAQKSSDPNEVFVSFR